MLDLLNVTPIPDQYLHLIANFAEVLTHCFNIIITTTLGMSIPIKYLHLYFLLAKTLQSQQKRN